MQFYLCLGLTSLLAYLRRQKDRQEWSESFIYLSTYCVIEKVISHVGLSFLRVFVATNIPEYLLGKSVFGENFQPTY